MHDLIFIVYIFLGKKRNADIEIIEESSTWSFYVFDLLSGGFLLAVKLFLFFPWVALYPCERSVSYELHSFTSANRRDSLWNTIKMHFIVVIFKGNNVHA